MANDVWTLQQWQEHITGLDPDALVEQAIAANQIRFVRSLEEDGLSPKDIAAVFMAFAQRMDALELPIPSRIDGAVVDYGNLLQPSGIDVPEMSV